ncbi:MAG TPA: hypothetical protein VJ552_10965 [Sediminibacterium sp.]|nr:hypothetical protein [Sediminibacterium sp.]
MPIRFSSRFVSLVGTPVHYPFASAAHLILVSWQFCPDNNMTKQESFDPAVDLLEPTETAYNYNEMEDILQRQL